MNSPSAQSPPPPVAPTAVEHGAAIVVAGTVGSLLASVAWNLLLERDVGEVVSLVPAYLRHWSVVAITLALAARPDQPAWARALLCAALVPLVVLANLVSYVFTNAGWTVAAQERGLLERTLWIARSLFTGQTWIAALGIGVGAWLAAHARGRPLEGLRLGGPILAAVLLGSAFFARPGSPAPVDALLAYGVTGVVAITALVPLAERLAIGAARRTGLRGDDTSDTPVVDDLPTTPGASP